MAEYDRFADIYAIWTDTAASTRANLAFYVDAYAAAEGPVVELGVGLAAQDLDVVPQIGQRLGEVTDVDTLAANVGLAPVGEHRDAQRSVW